MKIVKENKSKIEWNIRMIHADKQVTKKKTKKKNRVRIAVLDSGVNYGNDIDIDPSKTISLVPGESEITPLFICLLYTSPSPRDPKTSRMPSSA